MTINALYRFPGTIAAGAGQPVSSKILAFRLKAQQDGGSGSHIRMRTKVTIRTKALSRRSPAIGRRLQKHRSEVDEFQRSQEHIDECLDESLEESFPASDPPSWTLLTKIGSPR